MIWKLRVRFNFLKETGYIFMQYKTYSSTMTKFPAILIFALACIASCKPDSQPIITSAPDAEIEAVYDSALAAKYGADEYGMRKYVIAFLKRGPNQNQDSATAAELQMAHLKNIMEMAKQGKLVVAGRIFREG
ncbi:MAG: hypothetical protein U5K79_25965 [Cyclobacteriaceae bacterium]|nr:hypothetical protein [Cyclobacteriaceae bacterium]